MKILASGCSFTAGGSNGGENWPSMIQKRAYTKNLAVAGAGNTYISQVVVDELVNNLNFYDIVFVMWSGLQRFDQLVSKETYKNMKHSRAINKDRTWALVGDVYSHAHHDDSIMRTVGKNYFSLTDEETLGIQSLMNMIFLQSFLKSNNIPYRFMSYVNYWNDQSEITNLNFGVYKYQSCKKLSEQLDFDNFLFYNDNQDGFYEFAKEKLLLDSDGFHPNLQAHREWGAWVKEQMKDIL